MGAPYGSEYQPAPPSTRRKSFGAMEPETLTTVLLDLERGLLERPADLFSFMLRTDAHLRSVWDTRIDAVAHAPVDVTPNPADEAVLAEDAAQVTRDWLTTTIRWPDRFADLLRADAAGMTVLEHRWRPSAQLVRLDLAPTSLRDLRYRHSWSRPELRCYVLDETGRPTGASEWHDLRAQPDKWLVHEPDLIGETPGLNGLMQSVAWPWLFKRWVTKFGLEGYGRLANGLMLMRVPRNTEKAVRVSHLADLERLAADGVAVVDADASIPDPVQLLESAHDPGASAVELQRYWDGEISKGILGSGLNVEVQSTGGNRALGESQFDTTILPRLVASAGRALDALRHQSLQPYLRVNRHLFGGRVPQPPLLTARLVEDAITIDEYAVRYGRVTVDDVRMSRGLSPLGSEGGGDAEVIEVVGAPGGAPTASPFAATPSLSRPPKRPSARARTSSPTRSVSTSPLARALRRPSGDPAR